jgi:hypothetical protein
MQLAAIVTIVGVVAFVICVIAITEYDKRRTTARWRSRDSTVSAVLGDVDGRTRQRDAVHVDFVNGSSSPVLVGLSVRTEFWPGWWRTQQWTTVPSRPGRRRYRAGAQDTVGVIPANETSCLPVCIPPWARRCRVVAVIGEADRYLRVVSIRIQAMPTPEAERRVEAALDDLFLWLF